MSKYPLLLLSVLFLTGCFAQVSEYHKKTTRQYTEVVKDEKQIAKEFISKRWAFYRGALDEIIANYPNAFQTVVMNAKAILDKLYKRKEKKWTDRELGQIAVNRMFLVGEAIKAVLRKITPSLLGYIL